MKTRRYDERARQWSFPDVCIGGALAIGLLWLILFVAFGPVGTMVLAILLLTSILIGLILGIAWVIYKMTRGTIREVDEREYRQSSKDESRMFQALTQMAVRQDQTALRIAQLIQTESAKNIRAAIEADRKNQPKLPLLGLNVDESQPQTRSIDADNLSIDF